MTAVAPTSSTEEEEEFVEDSQPVNAVHALYVPTASSSPLSIYPANAEAKAKAKQLKIHCCYSELMQPVDLTAGLHGQTDRGGNEL